jgi:hypothetical protein
MTALTYFNNVTFNVKPEGQNSTHKNTNMSVYVNNYVEISIFMEMRYSIGGDKRRGILSLRRQIIYFLLE